MHKDVHKETQGSSGGPEKEARLIRSGRANPRRNWSNGNLTICPLPDWMENSLRKLGGKVNSWLEK